MKKELEEIGSNIRWFLDRGASLKGYLDFYKDSHYDTAQIDLIYVADKQGHEVALKRYHKLAGHRYGDRRNKDRDNPFIDAKVGRVTTLNNPFCRAHNTPDCSICDI